MRRFFKNKKNAGYTLLETIIAVSIFSVVVTVGTSAMLRANSIYKKSQDMRSIMDNLSFIMEEMSRNLRTGSSYHCGGSGGETPLSCRNDRTLSFEEGTAGVVDDPTDQWKYEIAGDDTGSWIQKTTKNGTTQLSANEISFNLNASGFSVLGAEGLVPIPPNTTPNKQQPLVIIRLVGTINYKGNLTPFNIQTTVSQRLIDN